MVYLENKTTGQDVWIPRNDGDGYTHGGGKSYQEGYNDGVAHQKGLLSSTEFTENGEYVRTDGWSSVTVNVPKTTAVLEDKDVTISGETTVITPSSGYDGLSSVTVDASELAQENYDDGFDDGYSDGYSSGYTEGEQHQKDLLSSTALTVNGTYTDNDGWSAVTVNVAQTGHTDQEMQAEYNLGYSDGVAHQKSLLSTTAITANGEYTSENGWEEISVNVPQNNPSIETQKPFTATTNGTSSITPSPIWEILFTSKENIYDNYYHFTIDGTISSGYYGQAAYRLDYHNVEDYGYVLIKIDQNGGLELDTSNYDQETEPVWLRFDQSKGRYDFGGNRISASNFTEHPLSNVEYYYAMSAVELTVDVQPNVSTTAITANGTYTPSGLDGWSAVTVDVPQVHPSYGELYCLECESATFEIASANGLTQIDLNMASAQFIGDWSGWANQGSERIATWTTNTREIDGVDKLTSTLRWGVPPVTGTTPSYTAWKTFPDFYNGAVRKTSATTARISIDNATYSVSGATMYPVTSVYILSNGYLKSANFNDTYCSLIPAVDSDGNACLYWNGQYIYPTFGSCYPVYRRLVDNQWKYVVVRDI